MNFEWTWATVWPFIIAGLCLIASFLMMRRGSKRMVASSVHPIVKQTTERKQEETPFGGMPASTSLELQKRTESLMVELHDLAREVSGKMDTRIRALNNLIVEATVRMAELKNVLAQIKKEEETLQTTIPRPSGITNNDPPGNVRPIPNFSSKTEAIDVEETLNKLMTEGKQEFVSTYEERYAKIYSLADDEKTADQIAEELDRPVGEIQLILDLRKS